jgi:3,4-dihydroxy 2-butanone 4-phosphate synthase/GTP cyclohydrolase II
MQRAPQLQAFAAAHSLKVMLVSDLVRYRRASESIVRRTAVARVPTQWGDFSCYSYTSLIDGIEHVAMVHGEIVEGENVLVRVHSECLTGDIFQSRRCDCGPQLGAAMSKVVRAGRGVVVYLRGQEGRGIGLGHKLQAYNLQDSGRDTVQANEDLGLPVDSREYGTGAQMLLDLGVRSVKLMTNNPSKFAGLRGHGLAITGRVPLLMPIHKDNQRYIETKRSKMGHFSGSEFLAPGEVFGGIEPLWVPEAEAGDVEATLSA